MRLLFDQNLSRPSEHCCLIFIQGLCKSGK